MKNFLFLDNIKLELIDKKLVLTEEQKSIINEIWKNSGKFNGHILCLDSIKGNKIKCFK